jgi:hypothetical protein
MALKITKATDTIEVKNLTVCIYAVPGVGKSTLAFGEIRWVAVGHTPTGAKAGNVSGQAGSGM